MQYKNPHKFFYTLNTKNVPESQINFYGHLKLHIFNSKTINCSYMKFSENVLGLFCPIF